MEKNHPTLEKIMAEAYKKYPDDNKIDFYSVLNDTEKLVVAFGNLNYQVENGGWFQWVDNGYCNEDSVDALNEVLTRIGTKEALEVLNIVNWVASKVDLQSEDKGCFGSYWLSEKSRSSSSRYEDEDDDETPYDLYGHELDGYDKQFYAIHDEVLAQLEALISKEVAHA